MSCDIFTFSLLASYIYFEILVFECTSRVPMVKFEIPSNEDSKYRQASPKTYKMDSIVSKNAVTYFFLVLI